MKDFNILVGIKVADAVKEYLESFCRCEYCDAKGMPRNELLGKLKDKDGVMIMGIDVDTDFFDAAPSLKAVCNVSVGYDRVDTAEAARRNILVTNTPGILDETVADLVLGLMLSVSRRMVELDRYIRETQWKTFSLEDLFGLDVHHKTLGIIGMGNIGEAVARRACGGFSMNVLYHNRSRRPEAEKKWGAVYTELEDLLRESDFIVLLTPLTEKTRGMIGKREFSLMKNSAFLINASRGQTVDEKALIEALNSGEIAGAGLDVLEKEPVETDNPLLRMKNVVLTPHIGSSTRQTRERMAMLAAENMRSILETGKAVTPVYRNEGDSA